MVKLLPIKKKAKDKLNDMEVEGLMKKTRQETNRHQEEQAELVTPPNDGRDSPMSMFWNEAPSKRLGTNIVIVLLLVIVGGVGYSVLDEDVGVGDGCGEVHSKNLTGDTALTTSMRLSNTPEAMGQDISQVITNDNFNNTLHEPPKMIFLLGERNSGTNYIEKTALANAFYPRYSNSSNHRGKASYPFGGCSPEAHPLQAHSCSPVFQFKHMFRHTLLSDSELKLLRERDDILWVLAVRSPCDWADGMFRKPWHMCNPSDPPAACARGYIGLNKQVLKALDRQSFFADMPWWENEEAKFADEGGFVYPSVFHLRAHKLKLMLQLIQAVGPHRVKLAHLKYVELSPETFVINMAKEFGLELKSRRAKLKPSDHIHESNCLTEEEWRTAEAKIDWDLEGKFGFTPLDCHTCV